jgi:hypothetical protein
MSTYSNDITEVAEIDDVTAMDLIGVAEIADRLSKHAGKEITRSNISTWINRRDTQKNGFPTPITQVSMGGIYSWVEILDWWNAGIGRAGASKPGDLDRAPA